MPATILNGKLWAFQSVSFRDAELPLCLQILFANVLHDLLLTTGKAPPYRVTAAAHAVRTVPSSSLLFG